MEKGIEIIKLLKESKTINRLEIINHGKNIHPEGRFLVIKTKELNNINSVNNIEFQLQDNNETLKIFIK
jgi:hypothetical protein